MRDLRCSAIIVLVWLKNSVLHLFASKVFAPQFRLFLFNVVPLTQYSRIYGEFWKKCIRYLTRDRTQAILENSTSWNNPNLSVQTRGQSKTSKEQSEKSSCTRIHLHMPKKMSLNRTSATFKLANFFFFPGLIPVSFWSPITQLHTLVLAAVILQLHHLLWPDRIFTSS